MAAPDRRGDAAPRGPRACRPLRRRHGGGLRELVMDWDEIRTMAADPLVTIGAHTKGHFAISKLSRGARRATRWSAAPTASSRNSGSAPFISPFPMAIPAAPVRAISRWRASCGFKTAVTTRKGMLFPAHRRPSDRAAARLAERRLSVADLYGGLSVRRAVRAVEPLPAGRRRLSR